MKKIIAITGGIGSGKSTVLAYLREKGYAVFSCDAIYREIIDTPAYVKKIREVFPLCVVNGKIDKSRLAEIVFKDKTMREKLNDAAHPYIMQRLQECMREAEGCVFAEVPLLFEGNFENQFDYVLVVHREMEARIQSVIERDGYTRAQILDRIASQFDYDAPSAKKRFEDCNAVLLFNEGRVEDLKKQIDAFLTSIP